eukprot:scaffold41896_cov15-Tisochrysis_lutea.AAC.1
MPSCSFPFSLPFWTLDARPGDRIHLLTVEDSLTPASSTQGRKRKPSRRVGGAVSDSPSPVPSSTSVSDTDVEGVDSCEERVPLPPPAGEPGESRSQEVLLDGQQQHQQQRPAGHAEMGGLQSHSSQLQQQQQQHQCQERRGRNMSGRQGGGGQKVGDVQLGEDEGVQGMLNVHQVSGEDGLQANEDNAGGYKGGTKRGRCLEKGLQGEGDGPCKRVRQHTPLQLQQQHEHGEEPEEQQGEGKGPRKQARQLAPLLEQQ